MPSLLRVKPFSDREKTENGIIINLNGYNMTIGKVIWYWRRKPDIQYPETPPYLRCFRNKATY
ncbi:hypothetical protein C5472_05345 [Photorhabdus sp. RW14-46]|nr:hypothetical protein A4R40_13000 [Photorhabdus laumondii subsp. laumondii]NHB60583.1 hypothetical protein [Photorhabdus sp. RW14-46]RAW69829.1 hypothetical protein CKY15_12850 [Photorhabdus sp. S7-51]RAW71336.1 hypothetical protein CKY14_12325 [Photorhabdus sp. S14-60]RAW77256.1 hypothetical protein CKY06_12920 [Photorhabdus sp. S15-56]RAW84208.1 hypothetical protein CKY12_13075 [Photorhabdus sp. S12-55]RAW84314.1 hypothetical protein CKY09_12810 [Photorhabdus sp. S5P8-50]